MRERLRENERERERDVLVKGCSQSDTEMIKFKSCDVVVLMNS
jgi:hypothetical protein